MTLEQFSVAAAMFMCYVIGRMVEANKLLPRYKRERRIARNSLEHILLQNTTAISIADDDMNYKEVRCEDLY